jgi:hypothetical protein
MGVRRFMLKDHIALPTQGTPPRGVPDPLRLKQSIQDVVFVDEGQVEAGRESATQGRLSTGWQPRDHNERSAHS